jgi:hypothetical protein
MPAFVLEPVNPIALDFPTRAAYSGGKRKSHNDVSIVMQISKRDYFAAAALTGLLARTGGPGSGLDIHNNLATEAFLYADAMMKLTKTLADPVEFDPDQLAKDEEAARKKKEEGGAS